MISIKPSNQCFLSFILLWSFLYQVYSQSISTDLELEPPRLIDNHHRGFPTTVHLFERPPNLSSKHQSQSRWISRITSTFKKETYTSIPFTSKIVSVDLLGGITKVGEYYARIFIGSQPVRVQIDTGSSTLAFPVAECDHCLPGDQRYNLKLSRSGKGKWISCINDLCARDKCSRDACAHCSASDACCADENPQACGFKLKYGDGSLARGGLMEDVMTWGNVSAPVIFGGILHDSKDFQRPRVDGILGMSYESLACNPTCVEPPLQQMVKAGVIEDSFAICITEQGGKLVLGQFDDSLTKEKLTYVPLALSTPPTFYTMNLTNRVTIGDRETGVPNLRQGILDSGTTLVVVSETTFVLFLNHLRKFHCDVPGLCHTDHPWFMPTACVKLTDEEVSKLPSFKFHLGADGDFTLELRPEDYMLRMHKAGHENYRCVGIMALKKMQRGTDIIFGNTVMQRYVTHYDRKNKRLGFAEAAPGCGLSSLCESYTQCRECADAPQCSYNFKTGKCGQRAASLGIVPYPECTGSSCICGLGPQAGLAFGTLAGFLGSLVITSVGMLILFLYRKRSSRFINSPTRGSEAQYSIADEDEMEDGELQSTKGYAPVPNE